MAISVTATAAFNTAGTNNTTGYYKDISLTGLGAGDLLVAFGAAENYSSSFSTRTITTQSGSTSSWTIASGPAVTTSDAEYVMGWATVTSGTTATIRVQVRCNGYMGGAVWRVPAGEWDSGSTPSFTFAVGDTDGQWSATLSAASTILQGGGDYNTGAISAYTPAGGTGTSWNYGGFWAGFYCRWTGQASGTRAYGASGVSGRDISGAICIIAEPSAGVNGTASVAGAGSVSAVSETSAPATVGGVGSTSVAARQAAVAAVAGVGAVTAAGSVAVLGTASAAGAGSVSALATQGAGSTIAGAGSTTAAAILGSSGTVAGVGSTSALATQGAGSSVAGVGSVTASAGGATNGTASVAGSGSVSALATQAAPASATGVGSTSASPTQGASATVAGSGSLSAIVTQGVTASVTGAGAVTANGSSSAGATASVSGAGAVTALAALRAGSSATGAGSVAASATQRAGAAVAGSGAVTAAASVAAFGTATVTGVGSVNTPAVRLGAGATALGVGTVNALSAARAEVLGQGLVTAVGVEVPAIQPTYLLRPPTRSLALLAGQRIRIDRGVTLVVYGAQVTEEMWVKHEHFDTADHVYVGGHEYTVSQAEADVLTAAGYASCLTPQ